MTAHGPNSRLFFGQHDRAWTQLTIPIFACFFPIVPMSNVVGTPNVQYLVGPLPVSMGSYVGAWL